MHRLSLDANVLFSAAYRSDAGLRELWELRNTALCTCHYALEEARINLAEQIQRERLSRLAKALQFFDVLQGDLPPGIALPMKDVPILLSAIEAGATHWLTGDVRHFRQYFEKRIGGVLILPPAVYLKNHRESRITKP